MPDIAPRRRVDWLYTILGLMIASGVTWGAKSISDSLVELKKDVGNLRVDVAVLQTEIRSGMSDRFTGEQGKAMGARINALEVWREAAEVRLDTVEKYCTGLRGHTGP